MRFCAISIGFSLAVSLNPAHAQQSGKAALDEWLDDHRAIGVEATYDSVETAGNTLIISGLTFAYSVTFELPEMEATADLKGPISLSASWRTPRLTATGLSAGRDGFFADTMAFSSDTTFSVEVSQSQQAILDFDGKIENYALNGYGWPRFPMIDSDPSRPISRWMPFLTIINDYRLDLGGYSLLTADFTFAGLGEDMPAMTGNIESRDAVVKGMIDGRMAEYRDGGSIQKIDVIGPDGTPFETKTQTGPTIMKGMDYVALINLLDSDGQDTLTYRPYIDSYIVEGQQTDETMQSSQVKLYGIEGLSIRPPEINIVALADELVLAATKQAEPDAQFIKQAISGAFELYRSFSIKRAFAQEVSVSTNIPEFKFRLELGQMELVNMSSDGLGELSVQDVQVKSGARQMASIGSMTFGPVEFPAYEPIRDFIANFDLENEPDPMTMARLFMPTSMAYELNDVITINPDTGSDMSMGRFFLSTSSAVPPVPTELELSMSGVQAPISDLDDQDVEAIWRSMGLENVSLSYDMKLRWDEASEDLIVENLMIDIGELGTARASVRLGGIPRGLFENPEQAETIAQSAIFTASFKSAEISLIDEGAMEKALAIAADSQNASVDQIRETVLERLEAEMTILDNPAFSAMVLAAAAQYLEDPQNFRIIAAPEKPVAATAIMSAVTLAPGEMPDLLGITVSANK